MGILGEDSQKLEKYLDLFVSQGEYNHKEDQPFSKLLLTNLLDLTIIKPIVESCCGYDLITEEDLTDMERSLKLVFAIVDLVTLATGLYGFTLAAETMGAKEAVAYFARLAMVELAADVSATTVATIGEYCEWPAGLTILLSLGTGLTVGRVGNHLIFKQNGIEIFSKEVSESGGLLEDLMSPEDAEKFLKSMGEGSTAGLTPEELAGIRKVDDYLALNKVQYDDVLALRKEAIENSTGAFDEVPWEDLMSPEEAAGLRKFWQEGSTAGLTPEEMAGIRKVDDYLALNKVKYNEVLALRKGVTEGGTDVLDEVKRLDEIKIEFNYNSKFDEAEFARQLADQQKGMNELTVQEYLDNRQKYLEQGRAIEGNAAQQAARENAYLDKVAELRKNGLSEKDAKIQADKWIKSQAALHNPDQVAGGNASKVDGVGDKRVNFSIGSQWRYRIDTVDEQIRQMAESMTEVERKTTYLNVNLTYKGE